MNGDPLDRDIAHWVRQLGQDIGARNGRDRQRYAQLQRARDLLLALLQVGGHTVRQLPYEVDGVPYHNLELLLPGVDLALPNVVVGAHYDTAHRAPGANDNGTGVACMLALARLLADVPRACSVRLVAFVNEEPPHTRKPTMGSVRYARQLAAQGVAVRAMLSLESLAAALPWRHGRSPLFVVGNLRSRALVRELRPCFRDKPGLLTLPIVAPSFVPGVKSSDHWSFWREGHPAVMLTAGGPFTYRHYHRVSDRVEHVRTDHLLQIALGCRAAITGPLQHRARSGSPLMREA